MITNAQQIFDICKDRPTAEVLALHQFMLTRGAYRTPFRCRADELGAIKAYFAAMELGDVETVPASKTGDEKDVYVVVPEGAQLKLLGGTDLMRLYAMATCRPDVTSSVGAIAPQRTERTAYGSPRSLAGMFHECNAVIVDALRRRGRHTGSPDDSLIGRLVNAEDVPWVPLPLSVLAFWANVTVQDKTEHVARLVASGLTDDPFGANRAGLDDQRLTAWRFISPEEDMKTYPMSAAFQVDELLDDASPFAGYLAKDVFELGPGDGDTSLVMFTTGRFLPSDDVKSTDFARLDQMHDVVNMRDAALALYNMAYGSVLDDAGYGFSTLRASRFALDPTTLEASFTVGFLFYRPGNEADHILNRSRRSIEDASACRFTPFQSLLLLPKRDAPRVPSGYEAAEWRRAVLDIGKSRHLTRGCGHLAQDGRTTFGQAVSHVMAEHDDATLTKWYVDEVKWVDELTSQELADYGYLMEERHRKRLTLDGLVTTGPDGEKILTGDESLSCAQAFCIHANLAIASTFGEVDGGPATLVRVVPIVRTTNDYGVTRKRFGVAIKTNVPYDWFLRLSPEDLGQLMAQLRNAMASAFVLCSPTVVPQASIQARDSFASRVLCRLREDAADLGMQVGYDVPDLGRLFGIERRFDTVNADNTVLNVDTCNPRSSRYAESIEPLGIDNGSLLTIELVMKASLSGFALLAVRAAEGLRHVLTDVYAGSARDVDGFELTPEKTNRDGYREFMELILAEARTTGANELAELYRQQGRNYSPLMHPSLDPDDPRPLVFPFIGLYTLPIGQDIMDRFGHGRLVDNSNNDIHDALCMDVADL